MPSGFHREMLSPEGMRSAREALIARYQWLTHDSPVSAFEPIRRGGLLPSRPDGYFGPVPTLVGDLLGPGAERIVCLWPLGCAVFRSRVSRDAPLFRLALNGADLPPRIGLDWSFPESWALRGITKETHPKSPAADVFTYVVNGTGSVVSYDRIPPSALRVCPRGTPLNSDPSTWPLLVNVTDINEIEIIPPDRSQ
jgi:hypothetical protein